MRLTRCFSSTPLRPGGVVTLSDKAAAHLTRVLRLRPGAALVLFDGHGGEYAARLLDADRESARVQVSDHQAVEREAPLRLTLLQCLARGERMDWIVQKATELGVAVIVPVVSQYSVTQLDTHTGARRLAHWQAVTIGACEQCGRNRLPELRPICGLQTACREAEASAAYLLLSPEAPASLASVLCDALAAASESAAPGSAPSIALLVGPEGGFAAHELDAAQRCGFRPCRLGPRILRTETAPVAALAAIQALAGDFI